MLSYSQFSCYLNQSLHNWPGYAKKSSRVDCHGCLYSSLWSIGMCATVQCLQSKMVTRLRLIMARVHWELLFKLGPGSASFRYSHLPRNCLSGRLSLVHKDGSGYIRISSPHWYHYYRRYHHTCLSTISRRCVGSTLRMTKCSLSSRYLCHSSLLLDISSPVSPESPKIPAMLIGSTM